MRVASEMEDVLAEGGEGGLGLREQYITVGGVLSFDFVDALTAHCLLLLLLLTLNGFSL